MGNIIPMKIRVKRGVPGHRKEKNKARRRTLQLQPRPRCMAGAPLAASASARSKWSGANAPRNPNPPSGPAHRAVSHMVPTSRFGNGPDACVRACLGSPMPSVLFDAGSAQDRQSPKRCIGIEHRFGGRAGLLSIMSSIADQSYDLHMCHDDETQSRAQSDRRVPIVVARCHLLPTFLTSELPSPALSTAAMEKTSFYSFVGQSRLLMDIDTQTRRP